MMNFEQFLEVRFPGWKPGVPIFRPNRFSHLLANDKLRIKQLKKLNRGSRGLQVVSLETALHTRTRDSEVVFRARKHANRILSSIRVSTDWIKDIDVFLAGLEGTVRDLLLPMIAVEKAKCYSKCYE